MSRRLTRHRPRARSRPISRRRPRRRARRSHRERSLAAHQRAPRRRQSRRPPFAAATGGDSPRERRDPPRRSRADEPRPRGFAAQSDRRHGVQPSDRSELLRLLSQPDLNVQRRIADSLGIGAIVMTILSTRADEIVAQTIVLDVWRNYPSPIARPPISTSRRRRLAWSGTCHVRSSA